MGLAVFKRTPDSDQFFELALSHTVFVVCVFYFGYFFVSATLYDTFASLTANADKPRRPAQVSRS